MSSHSLEIIETKANELIDFVLKVCRDHDSTIALPQPLGSNHHAIQYSVLAFVAVTKLLVILCKKAFTPD